jgi:hypothetical protein
MAGATVGKVNCYHPLNSAANQQQEGFKNCFDFMEQMVTAGYATRIALQYGASGTGTGYHDEAAPFGENAFMLYRMNGAGSGNSDSRRDGADLPDFDYYVLFQYAETASFGTSPGNPGKSNNSTQDGLAVAVACRADGASPWNGTTNNDGTDTKGAAVWTAGGSTLFIFPISNGYTGGTHLTNKENMKEVHDFTGTTTQQCHHVGNADSIILFNDTGHDGTYFVTYIGIYSPRNGLTPAVPLVCASHESTVFPWTDGASVIWGTTTGATAYEGGVVGQLAADLMSPLSIGHGVTGVLTPEAQPNCQFDPPKYDVFPYRVAQRGSGRNGYVGDWDPSLVNVTYGAPTNSTDANGNWCYIGAAAEDNYKLAIAWDSSVGPPSALVGREGETF